MGEVVDHTKLVLDLLNKQRLERDGSSCDVYLYSKNDDSKQLAPIRAHRSLLSLNPTIYNMLNKGKDRQGDISVAKSL